jgi:mannose-6-phosphate isomerase-like protein (cupin superfamily)
MNRDDTKPMTLGPTFAHMLANGNALVVPVDDAFWSDGVSKLPTGWLVSVLDNKADWTSWEMHLGGEELILDLSGRISLNMEHAGTTWSEDVVEGQFVLVPRGVWHTADVLEPGRLLFVTAGENTQSRERF